MSDQIRVLVVDDSAFSRQTIKKMLEQADDIEVVGVASNGMDAIGKTLKLNPDLITLDFQMPEMDGLTFLRWIMKEHPLPVIMVSSHDDNALSALEMGAVDFVVKPTRRASLELKNIEKDLLAKVRGITGLKIEKVSQNIERLEIAKVENKTAVESQNGFGLVAIGASTGGPPALQMLLSEIPRNFPCGIVISQHMPRGFTKSLADRLNRSTMLNVKEASHGDPVDAGKVLVCPGGTHIGFRWENDEYLVELNEARESDKYVPSVDAMMISAAQNVSQPVMGVVLTGMGNDGTKGIVEIRKRGGYTIAESEETAVVFGMPGEAIKTGSVEVVAPMDMIAKEIVRVAMGERRKR